MHINHKKRGSKMKKLFKSGCVFFVVFFIIFLSIINSRAEDFCAQNANDLHTALFFSENNGEDDVIKLVQGTYVGNFVFSSFEEYHLTIEGGYEADSSMISYARPTRFAPVVEDRIIAAAKDLVPRAFASAGGE